MEREINEMQRKVNCQASSVWLKEGDIIYPYIFFGKGSNVLKDVEMKSDMGLCGYCITHNEEIISNDLKNDTRWNNMIDKQTGITTKNVICLPIAIFDEVYGCVELINKIDGDFTKEDIAICREIVLYIVENM